MVVVNGTILRNLADYFLPGYSTSIYWGDVWKQPMSSGKSFEWTLVAALASQAKIRGYNVDLVPLQFPHGEKAFSLWNEIPRHHAAQAGHNVVLEKILDLKSRFLHSLIPKLFIYRNHRFISVFREGCPYHSMFCGKVYSDRPDILLLSGRITDGFPKANDENQEIEFSFETAQDGNLKGTLRVINSILMPLRTREPRGEYRISVGGLVECSINKSLAVVQSQIRRYVEIFSSEEKIPAVTVVTGNRLDDLGYPASQVDLTKLDQLENSFRAAADTILDANEIYI